MDRLWLHHIRRHPARVTPASDALPSTSPGRLVLTPVRSFASRSGLCGSATQLLRPLLLAPAQPSPFQAQGEISPGKNALLHCTTAGFTPLRLDHESFAVPCPLALLGSAFYPVLVHRLAASLHASFPHSVTLMQLRFASFVAINSRRDLHPQECAHAGRTWKRPVSPTRAFLLGWWSRGELNPRPQAITGQIYMLSRLV